MNKSTLIIYDWDDTLFPTTVITQHKNNESKREMSDLDNQVHKLLVKSLHLGYPIIITNATRSWIKDSANKYYPKTYSFIIKNNIPVISAREFAKSNNVHDHIQWKNVTFKYFLTILMNKNKNIKNLLSIGDAMYEKIALEQFGKTLNSNEQKSYIKTIKYISRPTILNLLKENILINNNLEHIISKNDHAEIYLQHM